MKQSRVLKAVKEAEEFLQLAKELETEEAKSRSVYVLHREDYAGDSYGYASPKYRTALKRKSMDLTRALSDLRRSDND